MKSAIITGASRGIGRAAAMLLAKEYEYIAICSRASENELNQTSEIIRTSADNHCICRTFVGDIANYDFVSSMTNEVISDCGSIDTLINNAGISIVGLFTDTTPDEWQRIMNVNLTSVYNTCHCVVPHMIHEKSGEVAYSATKGAINSFTKALAKELAPSNIAVNAIAFGAIDTSMNGHLDPDELAALEEEIPYGRMATQQEAAECIQNILSMPSYFTGEIVKFDGAWI